MIQENEIVMLLLGFGVLIFVFVNYHTLKRIHSSNLLITSYCILCAGWFLTVLEGFFLKTLLNYAEHICYAVSSFIFAVWFWQIINKKTRNND